MFFTNQATSIDLAPRNTDSIMNMLYRMSLDVYGKALEQDVQSLKELKRLNDTYYAQYEEILSLLKGKSTSKSSTIEYMSQAAKYNKQQKRKSDELFTEDDIEGYQNERPRCQRTTTDSSVTFQLTLKYKSNIESEASKSSTSRQRSDVNNSTSSTIVPISAEDTDGSSASVVDSIDAHSISEIDEYDDIGFDVTPDIVDNEQATTSKYEERMDLNVVPNVTQKTLKMASRWNSTLTTLGNLSTTVDSRKGKGNKIKKKSI
ncbi:hypothetical protein BCV72DRAFT_83152 [Rhizopus microsporus var. microsporus]|uniref:Uncharacterized protein n=2 Tax=Rhizopus microsporus TaxID=58291 RepID=A0A2G4T3R5_RHIZD|nr:uncharacterized protein RHIMIDRAFT_273149 [Rhizopus microsporus ATCC 52813]ORE08766.1 hypothetical protein BCV72DRAFT_83152 [Rhizopus microsporus var. microsporus]PHZ15654.1 hypothetical protein RHIMIDRAFT_273149 [Rhizopus microsporus ATCC 52813]